jgi:integrase
LIKLAFATGLRQGELIALEWSDIDFDRRIISVNKSSSMVRNRDKNAKSRYQIIVKEPKNESSIREVPITESMIEMLKEHKKKGNLIKRINKNSKVNKNLVFPSISGTLIHPTNLRRYWKKIVEKAGVRYLNFHTTRHCFATRLLDEGVQHKVVQELLGHSKISTTLDIYTHVDDNLKENAISKIDHMFKKNK